MTVMIMMVVVVEVVMEEGTIGDEVVKVLAMMVTPMVSAVIVETDPPGHKFPRQMRFCRCPRPSRWPGACLRAALGGSRRESLDKP